MALFGNKQGSPKRIGAALGGLSFGCQENYPVMFLQFRILDKIVYPMWRAQREWKRESIRQLRS